MKHEPLEDDASGLLLLVSRGSAVLVPDLVDEGVENFVDVDVRLCRALHEGAAITTRQFLSFLSINFTLLVQIALVSDEHHGDVGAVLVTDDSLTDGIQVFQAALGGDTVDEYETLQDQKDSSGLATDCFSSEPENRDSAVYSGPNVPHRSSCTVRA